MPRRYRRSRYTDISVDREGLSQILFDLGDGPPRSALSRIAIGAVGGGTFTVLLTRRQVKTLAARNAEFDVVTRYRKD